MAKSNFSFLLNFRLFRKEESSSLKSDFILTKVGKLFKLRESAHRDTKMYIPDIFCV
jgi:hypothetical protein